MVIMSRRRMAAGLVAHTVLRYLNPAVCFTKDRNMKSRVLLIALLLILCGAIGAQAAWVDPVLLDELDGVTADTQINVIAVLWEQLDVHTLLDELDEEGVSLARRHFEVVTAAQDLAESTQGSLTNWLQSRLAGSDDMEFRAFWIMNAVAVRATPEVIRELMNRPEIKSLYFDYPIELIEPVGDPVPAPEARGIENGVTVSRAPELWAMGVDGTGALACDQDTGADGTHPAFADRWRGLDPGVEPAHAWFDPVSAQTFPTDSGSHGTHTLGTMLGDDGGDNQIGMAPGAKWIGAKTIDVPGGDIFSDAVAAFEWSADPDDDPGTMEDVPDVVNNSWGLHTGYYGSCRDDFNASIDVAEAAGVVVVFAAGNEGSGSQSLRSPANRIATDLNTFAVAALNQDGTTVAGFSSRGPSDCDGSTIKPEVSAVGVDVRSSVPGGSYTTMSGTSMACPHVAGGVLLLRSAFPEATPEQVKMALYLTAVDLGAAGEDNTFGMGRIDMVEAYLWLMQQMVNSDGKVRMDDLFNCADTIDITVADIDLTDPTVNVTIVSDTETTPETVTLAATANDGVYEGSINTTAATPGYGNGILSLADGDAITVTYIDADDGNGNYNVPKTDEAEADCAPPTFAGLTDAIAGDYIVTLTWDPGTDPHGVVYNVYRADSPGAYNFDVPLATVSESPYDDEEVINNETFYYIVRAQDAGGNEDNNSVELSATPFGPNRLFTDDFEDVDNISQWIVVNAGACGETWHEDSCGSGSWCDGTIAFVDHDDCIPFFGMDEELISPAIDCSDHIDIELRFAHYFDQEGMEIADVDYSLDGSTWVNLERYRFDSSQGDQALDMSMVDGEPQVYIRYHFHNAGLISDDWGIDDVELVGWPAPVDDDTVDDDTVDDDVVDDDVVDDDVVDDDVVDDDVVDDDVVDDDVVDDDVVDDDVVDDDVVDDDVVDDDAVDDDTFTPPDDDTIDDDTIDDDAVGDDDDDDDSCGCGC